MDQSTTYSSDRTGSPSVTVNGVNFCDSAGMVPSTNNSGDRTGRPGGRVNVAKSGDGPKKRRGSGKCQKIGQKLEDIEVEVIESHQNGIPGWH